MNCLKKKFVIFDDDAITLISTILNCSLSDADLYRRAFKKQNFKTKVQVQPANHVIVNGRCTFG